MSCYFEVCSKLYLVLLPLPVLFCVFSSTLCQILHFLPLCVSLCCDCAPPYYVPPLPNYPSPLCMSPPVSMSDCLCIMCWALQQFPPCARLPVSLTLSVFDFFFSSAFSLWLCLHGSTNNPCTEQFLPQVEFFFFNFNTASGVMHLSLPVPANQSLPVSVICYNSNILTARLIYHDNQLFSYFKTELEVTVHLKKKRTSSCSRMLEKIRNKRKMFRSSAPNFIAENQIVE